jgi:hypothetical protein
MKLVVKKAGRLIAVSRVRLEPHHTTLTVNIIDIDDAIMLLQ